MDIRQCKRCGKVFQFSGSTLCPKCVREVDKQFDDVRNFLYDNPHSTLETVVEETKVNAQDIKRWLKEGRLILTGDSTAMIQCESCGKPILTGKLCETCAVQAKCGILSLGLLKKESRPERKSTELQGVLKKKCMLRYVNLNNA